jgi:hypothetical protein
MGRYRSGIIRIDVSDVIEEIEDDDLVDELWRRRLTMGHSGHSIDLEIVLEAHDALVRGRPVEARRILECLLLPKWKNVAECEASYDLWKRNSEEAA